jgi:S-methylmethionine-dependent homocysteine/selenocysteine methylase
VAEPITAPVVAGADTGTPYGRIEEMITQQRCVILDGGVGTEVSRALGAPAGRDERLWATRSLIDAPGAVLDVHRAYLSAGCNVISTNTWGVTAWRDGREAHADLDDPVHWIDIARRGLRLARTAVEEDGRGAAVAFSLNGDIEGPDGPDLVRLLGRLFDDDPAPDLILLETLSVVRPELHAVVRDLVATGLPVWLSFRRCRHGLCGIFGEHWGGPEGDSFGRAARDLEETGVAALLVNCVPPDHIDGMIPFLRDFTDMPLGVYPNLGYLSDAGWRFDAGVGEEEFARLALRWREEGAQVIGGCCGVRPPHIAALGEALAETAPGAGRRAHDEDVGRNRAGAGEEARRSPWLDHRGREMSPVRFPKVVVDEGVAGPDDAGFLVWRHLEREGLGAHQRCLDVGCGSGLLAVQLALNGAEHVHAMDLDPSAVQNTLTNAFRNGVDGRVSVAAVDLYPWTPEERFDLIVANLDQSPMDPLETADRHKMSDYWGRGMLDSLIGKLPDALAEDGIALVVQLSYLSQRRTEQLLATHGLSARVVDVRVFGHRPGSEARRRQIDHVERLSDAYHLKLGSEEAAVAYLLEISRGPEGDRLPPGRAD